MTDTMARSKVQQIRDQVKHPIIDSDGHTTEFGPSFRERFLEAVSRVAGSALRKEMTSAPNLVRYLMERSTPMGQAFGASAWAGYTPEERRANGAPIPAWGPPHANPLDKATTFVPRLRYERMEEIGIDYSILYPSGGLLLPHLVPDELRQVACRAMNITYAEIYGEFADRMTPVAVIPVNTADEAIAELEFAVTELGYKVGLVGHVTRPIEQVHRDHPDYYNAAFRVDPLALDSDYDYDPFWAKCAELKVPLTAHNFTYGIGFRRSPTNYLYNQTTTFAEAGDLFCRALFLGGVTRRFPTLKFQFLECGVGWACVLYAELLHRWEKRNIGAVREYERAAREAQPEFVRLVREHGDALMRKEFDKGFDDDQEQMGTSTAVDDFAACQIESVEDVRDLFVSRFFFGCEADDPITPWAFNTKANPLGARLRATLGSDMGHWDVPDMRMIVPEAYEAVEHGAMDEADFRRFTFSHPCELFAGVNPDFFKGTSVEPYVADGLRDAAS